MHCINMLMFNFLSYFFSLLKLGVCLFIGDSKFIYVASHAYHKECTPGSTQPCKLSCFLLLFLQKKNHTLKMDGRGNARYHGLVN
jgi:hypothetical protein